METLDEQYFGEKTGQVSTHAVTAFGIDLVSRYAKARELAELLAFAEGIARESLHHIVQEAFYDSNSCCCTFKFNYDIEEFGPDSLVILEVARKTISQFIWFGYVEHGGPMRNEDS